MSGKQALLTMSTTEIGMIAVMEAFKEQKVIHELFEVSKLLSVTWTIYCDDRAVINTPHTTYYFGRAKHIEPWFLPIKKVVRRREIELEQCASKENRAD